MNVLAATATALQGVDYQQVDTALGILEQAHVVFCIGNGGGYAHASHFASDLRKIAHKRAFALDNGAELTARVNDNGWDSLYKDWIYDHLYDRSMCAVFVFSVGGGSEKVSRNLVNAYDRGVLTGIVGKPGGLLARDGQPIIIPSESTPVIEGCQSVLAHHLVEALCG